VTDICGVQEGTIAMKALPLSKTFHLIEPGPVVLVTTAQKGHAKISRTACWNMRNVRRILPATR
jgi:hypothetical protein